MSDEMRRCPGYRQFDERLIIRIAIGLMPPISPPPVRRIISPRLARRLYTAIQFFFAQPRKRLFKRGSQFLKRRAAGFPAQSKIVFDQVLHILFHRQSKVPRAALDGRRLSRRQFNPWKNCCRRHNQLRLFNRISPAHLLELRYYTAHPWVMLAPKFQAVSTTLAVI
jgi:hypothetical protein